MVAFPVPVLVRIGSKFLKHRVFYLASTLEKYAQNCMRCWKKFMVMRLC